MELDNICQNCGKKGCEELVTREGFKTTYYCEWVCLDCFYKLEGCSFEFYGKKEASSDD